MPYTLFTVGDIFSIQVFKQAGIRQPGLNEWKDVCIQCPKCGTNLLLLFDFAIIS